MLIFPSKISAKNRVLYAAKYSNCYKYEIENLYSYKYDTNNYYKHYIEKFESFLVDS